MKHKIQTVYVVHHSHTDIGYTDLQERVLATQVDYIRSAIALLKDPANEGFRWNCETWFCVERFLEEATEAEKADFFRLAREGRMGLSGSYLNFTDLADCDILQRRMSDAAALTAQNGAPMKTAMIADINGISMGYRDALLAAGVEFLFTNIHTHHGTYPLYQNQNAYWWENAAGQRLLVWNGEHYHLGNALGVMPNRPGAGNNIYFGLHTIGEDAAAELHKNLSAYLTQCEDAGYPYDFIITSVSGVYSDNAPPEPAILRNIQEFNRRFGDETQLQMVSLQELYPLIRDHLADAPVYRGDLTDWWANGVGSTPYAVKHFREGQHLYHLCQRLEPDCNDREPALARSAQDNLLLYAEHTWGHSSTITNPYETMVLNLDMRKSSYASKAHESAALMLNHIARRKGDTLRYYHDHGSIRVINPSDVDGVRPVEFYLECGVPAMRVTDESGRELTTQISAHPRGRLISFADHFAPHEEKRYRFEAIPARPYEFQSRALYSGAERVHDIVNEYNPVDYRLPYEFENRWFRLQYRPGEGVTALVDRRTGRNLQTDEGYPLFTPLYECTKLHNGDTYEDRRLLGRNIRGAHAQLFAGKLMEIHCRDHGDVFTTLELQYDLPGTIHCSVFLKLYEALPRIDFRLEIGKTLSPDIESVFLPLTVNLPEKAVYLRKGGREAFRPGVDQLPGSCIEYWMTDEGLACVSGERTVLIATPDVPLLYMGEMRHHPIRLCEGRASDNRRPVYSWVMNNTWETNFKMDLSGFCQFNYTLWLSDERDPEAAMDELRERTFNPHVLIVE